MRVMYDSQIFCSQRFGGISRYVCSLAFAFGDGAANQPLIVAPWHFNEHLNALQSVDVYGRYLPWLEGVKAAAYFAGLLPSAVARRRFNPDIVHRTYYYPTTRGHRFREVITVYDMIHEKFAEGLSASSSIVKWKAASVLRADHVICISENTRRDVLEIYGIPEERVSVTYLGCDRLDGHVEVGGTRELLADYLDFEDPFILYVGSRVGYKNFDGLLSAFAMSDCLSKSFVLLCFGGGGFTDVEKSAISKLKLTGRVKVVGGSDRILANCYSQASLFVYPSHYEGFGIPPLEAMSVDCPVACSNTSSLPEVVGDAAFLFDPSSPDSISSAMEQCLGSNSLRISLVERGRARVRRFSWEKCAADTSRVYRHTLGTSE